ncbi:MAG TPA: hypothetical protein VGB82_07760 [Alphaproteobacteria bacterium]
MNRSHLASATAFAAVLLIGAGAADAAPIASTAAASTEATASYDQQADNAARHDVQIASADLAAGKAPVGRDRLERAETALLNREVLDLGPALNTDRPLPKTQAIAELDQARAALDSHNIAAARQLTPVIERDIGDTAATS